MQQLRYVGCHVRLYAGLAGQNHCTAITQATARKINRRRKAGPSLMHAVKITRAYYVRNVDQVTCFAHSADSSRYSQTERSQQGDVCHRAGAGKRWRSGTGFLVPAPAQQCMGLAMETCRSARYPQQCQKRENRRKGREQACSERRQSALCCGRRQLSQSSHPS